MPIVTRTLTRYPDMSVFAGYNRRRYPCALISTASRQVDETSSSLSVPGNHNAVSLNASIGRYDIVFAFPQETLLLDHAGQLKYIDSLGCQLEKVPQNRTFFAELDQICTAQVHRDNAENAFELPFTGGWFVYLSYEMAAEVEPCLHLPVNTSLLPQAAAARIPVAIIRDRIRQTCTLVAEKAFEGLLDTIEEDINILLSSPPNTVNASTHIPLKCLQESAERPYLSQVERIKQYIYDGDIFQANLSRSWQAVLDDEVDDNSLFQHLAEQNPSSFAALVCFEQGSIISSSPERLVCMRQGLIETRPIAGTRPRSANPQQDREMADELLAHPKEQAEHIMLIDLERNDLGRVCVPGSIYVNELMGLESWQHVHHIVSNIQGRCRDGQSSVDVLKAVFPGGTITGCPKVRCMEILAEQEGEARGAYTGSLGYITRSGDMDFNILIRTLVREKDKLLFRAGGGIVADSIAEHELAETRAKARGLLKIFSIPDFE